MNQKAISRRAKTGKIEIFQDKTDLGIVFCGDPLFIYKDGKEKGTHPWVVGHLTKTHATAKDGVKALKRAPAKLKLDGAESVKLAEILAAKCIHPQNFTVTLSFTAQETIRITEAGAQAILNGHVHKPAPWQRPPKPSLL